MLKSSNFQELFDHALAGVRGQNGPSWDVSANDCMYFDHSTGNKCAVGHCLTDEAMEHARTIIGNVDEVIEDLKYNSFFVKKKFSTVKMRTFLEELQNAHDEANKYLQDFHVADDDDVKTKSFIGYFNTNMEKVAKRNNLTYE